MTEWRRTTVKRPGLVVAIVTCLAIPTTLLYAWVLMTLWGWFVAPLGVHAIGFWHAVGLLALVRLLVFVPREKVPEERMTWGDAADQYNRAFAYVAVALMALAWGAIAS